MLVYIELSMKDEMMMMMMTMINDGAVHNEYSKMTLFQLALQLIYIELPVHATIHRQGLTTYEYLFQCATQSK